MIVTYLLYRKSKQGKTKSAEEPEVNEKFPPPDLTENSPYNEDARANGGLHQIAADDINPNYMNNDTNSVSMFNGATTNANTNSAAMFNGANVNTYSVSMANNGPGPVFAAAAVPRATGRAEEEQMHYYGDERDSAPGTPGTQCTMWPSSASSASSHHRTASLATDIESIDSPIDSSSPFRLKRGDTLRKKHGSLGASPLARHSTSSSDAGSYAPSSSTSSGQSSPKGSEFEYNGLKRENSFSRPRPSRPKTGASSIYTDHDRDTRVLSWTNDDGNMPPMPEPARLDAILENESFSRPAMLPEFELKKHDSLEAAVAAIASGKITPPTEVMTKQAGPVATSY